MSGVLIAAMLFAGPAPIADERRLSPAEVERILEEAGRKAAAPEKSPARTIEGEVGLTIGTGGIREVHGPAVVPSGAAGTAILSVERAETRRHKRRRR